MTIMKADGLKILMAYFTKSYKGQTITKITINGLSKFNFERPFYVIFVIVMFN